MYSRSLLARMTCRAASGAWRQEWGAASSKCGGRSDVQGGRAGSSAGGWQPLQRRAVQRRPARSPSGRRHPRYPCTHPRAHQLIVVAGGHHALRAVLRPHQHVRRRIGGRRTVAHGAARCCRCRCCLRCRRRRRLRLRLRSCRPAGPAAASLAVRSAQTDLWATSGAAGSWTVQAAWLGERSPGYC